MPAAPKARETAPRKRMELMGVGKGGGSGVNQAGKRSFQPATIGMRVVAVKTMLALASDRQVRSRMAAEAASVPAPIWLKPARNTCGMGPIKSMRSGGTKASTELVPRM